MSYIKSKAEFMKKVIISAIAITFCVLTYAGDLPESQVPVAVKNAVSKKYANAQKLEWEKKGSFYQAEFKIDKKEFEVLVDEKGNIVKAYEDISAGELPAKVSQSIQKSYPNHKIDDVEKVTKDGSVMYKVELKDGKTDFEIFYNHNGEVIEQPIR